MGAGAAVRRAGRVPAGGAANDRACWLRWIAVSAGLRAWDAMRWGCGFAFARRGARLWGRAVGQFGAAQLGSWLTEAQGWQTLRISGRAASRAGTQWHRSAQAPARRGAPALRQ
jgi:hypothetical protein